MIALAPVVRQTAQAIEFEVDAVEPCAAPLAVSPVRARLEALIGSRLLALCHDPACAEISETARHPLVSAVHLAFSEHRPLTLLPDAIWGRCVALSQQSRRVDGERHEEWWAVAGRPVDTVEPEFDFPVKLLEREGLRVIGSASRSCWSAFSPTAAPTTSTRRVSRRMG